MKPLYIFDLDGTLADYSHRLRFIQQEPKDWSSFFDSCDLDKPIEPVIETANFLHNGGADLWIFTGRNEIARNKTIHWLSKHGAGLFLTIRMRPQNDRTQDRDLKEKWLLELSLNDRKRLVGVFEDRQRVVDMWRNNGVFCRDYHIVHGKTLWTSPLKEKNRKNHQRTSRCFVKHHAL